MPGAVKTGPREALLDEDVKFLAENSDLSPKQAEELIALHGRDRKVLLEKARSMKAEG
ncbi:MAG: hypothetical protein M9939_18805 [Mesorhizobium sp.]|nr:hypothetical protein [Mesorhizobium sp.]MCO5163189.1 hypothetical protein [Mesorhizobium sp.]